MGGYLLGYTRNPVIPNGPGFSGATPQPPVQGNSGDVGYSENAIARFNVVPNQTFNGTLRVGVVATSISKTHDWGIDHVGFIANGGPQVTVWTPSLNSDTNTVEYWAYLRASDFPDGQIEIRAIAYPNAGVPRVLGPANPTAADPIVSLFLNANSGGTLPSLSYYLSPAGNDSTGNGSSGNPWLTIKKALDQLKSNMVGGDVGGGIIYLKAGSYAFTTNSGTAPSLTQWFCISAAPGVLASAVTLTTDGLTGLDVQKIRLSNLIVDGTTAFRGELFTDSPIAGLPAIIWLDTVTYVGPGRTVANANCAPSGLWTGGAYWTDSDISACQFGPDNCPLARNVNIHDITGVALHGNFLNVNCTVSSNFSASPDNHCDIWFNPTAINNSISYGLVATSNNQCRGIAYADQATVYDQAVINAAINCTAGPGGQNSMQLGHQCINCYWWNCRVQNGAVFTTTFTAVDNVYDTVTFDANQPQIEGQGPGIPAGVTIR